jgi:hypothetical protein
MQHLHNRYIGGDGSTGSDKSNVETALENVPSTTLPLFRKFPISANWVEVNGASARKPSVIITDPVSILIIPHETTLSLLLTAVQNAFSMEFASSSLKDCAFKFEFPQESRVILAIALQSVGLVIGFTSAIY